MRGISLLLAVRVVQVGKYVVAVGLLTALTGCPDPTSRSSSNTRDTADLEALIAELEKERAEMQRIIDSLQYHELRADSVISAVVVPPGVDTALALRGILHIQFDDGEHVVIVDPDSARLRTANRAIDALPIDSADLAPTPWDESWDVLRMLSPLTLGINGEEIAYLLRDEPLVINGHTVVEFFSKKVGKQIARPTCRDGEIAIAYDPERVKLFSLWAFHFLRAHEAGHHVARHVKCDGREPVYVEKIDEQSVDCIARERILQRDDGPFILGAIHQAFHTLNLPKGGGYESSRARAAYLKVGCVS